MCSSSATKPNDHTACAIGQASMSVGSVGSNGRVCRYQKPATMISGAIDGSTYCGIRLSIPSWWAMPRIQQEPNIAKSLTVSQTRPQTKSCSGKNPFIAITSASGANSVTSGNRRSAFSSSGDSSTYQR